MVLITHTQFVTSSVIPYALFFSSVAPSMAAESIAPVTTAPTDSLDRARDRGPDGHSPSPQTKEAKHHCITALGLLW